jgi:hypothetical protein
MSTFVNIANIHPIIRVEIIDQASTGLIANLEALAAGYKEVCFLLCFLGAVEGFDIPG